MKQSLRASEIPFVLSRSLQQRLNMYARAASAAGVSLLALAQPSAAKVIYTKTHQVIGQNGVYNLDLNHDGTTDFLIQQCCGRGSSSINSNGLLAKEALGNAVEGSVAGSHNFAAALKAGAQIGPKQGFVHGGYQGEILASVTHCCTTGSSHVIGHWVDVKNRYLGLRFKIDGKTHYGWARLSVQVQGFHITGTLTGYAYENIPNKGIVAGQTTGNADAAVVSSNSLNSNTSGSAASASLGALALGAQSAPARRRP